MQERVERGLGVRWHDVPGRPVRSLVAGSVRSGVPELVLVPGLGACGYLAPLARACAAWTRVHLLDVPGFGTPRTSRLPADLEAAARAVGAWVSRVPVGPVVLAGHSTGAQAALSVAVAEPHAVASLVLGGITFPPSARSLPAVAGRVLRTLPHEQLRKLLAVLPYYRRGLPRLPQLLRMALRDEPETRVGVVPAPLVVVRGRHDRLCPCDWAELLAEAAPLGQVVEIGGAHNAWFTEVAAAAEVLRGAAAVDR